MSAPPPIVDEEDGTIACCAPLTALRRPVEIGQLGGFGGYAGESAFLIWPFFGPLLFENSNSDARDHLALERITMSIVAVALVLSFHLKREPTELELRMARPLGAIFWVLSLLALLVGVSNYIKTVNKYSRRAAIVQSGWKTQSIMAVIASCIVGACILLLVLNKLSEEGDID